MKSPLVAFGLLVAGVSAAQAQAVISRQIAEEPVETIVTQGPYGTVVTRRPLYDTPVVAAPLAPAPGTVTVRPYALTPPASIPIVAEGADDEEAVVTTRRRVSARPARQARAAPVRSTRVTRTRTVRVGAPLDLTPAQSRTIYRTVVERRVYQPAPTIAVTPQVYEGAYASYPSYPSYPAYAPAPTYAPAYAYQAPAVTYTVGAPLPASVAVAPLPEPVVAQIPVTRGYRYAVIGGRVLLIDPATGVVVADVTQ